MAQADHPSIKSPNLLILLWVSGQGSLSQHALGWRRGALHRSAEQTHVDKCNHTVCHFKFTSISSSCVHKDVTHVITGITMCKTHLWHSSQQHSLVWLSPLTVTWSVGSTEKNQFHYRKPLPVKSSEAESDNKKNTATEPFHIWMGETVSHQLYCWLFYFNVDMWM